MALLFLCILHAKVVLGVETFGLGLSQRERDVINNRMMITIIIIPAWCYDTLVTRVPTFNVEMGQKGHLAPCPGGIMGFFFMRFSFPALSLFLMQQFVLFMHPLQIPHAGARNEHALIPYCLSNERYSQKLRCIVNKDSLTTLSLFQLGIFL